MIHEKGSENASPKMVVAKVVTLQSFLYKYGAKFKELNEVEAGIIEKIANDSSETQIAEEMGLTGAELQAHLISARNKLSVLDESDFATYGLALGLIRIWYDSLKLVIEREEFDSDFKNVKSDSKKDSYI